MDVGAAQNDAHLLALHPVAFVHEAGEPHCARALGETWPDPLVAPCFATEGRAWLGAAAECQPSWSPSFETAWRQAWLLLSDVLAAESLSPFQSPNPTNPMNREATRNLT